jgi:hypothetical protein
MKNLLLRALTIAAFMAVGASAFAQLTINGYYRAGGNLNVPPSDAGSKDATAAFADRIRLNLSFAAPDDMYGFKARLQADSSGTTSGLINLFSSSAATSGTVDTTVANTKQKITATTTVTPLAALKFGEVYAKFLDGMIKITAGKLDVTDYMVTENIGNIYFGNVATDAPVLKGSLLGTQSGNTTGTILQVWPIENLSAAVMMRTDGTNPMAHHYGVDAYYMLPGIGKAIFSSQLGYYNASDAIAYDDLNKSFASLGFSYTGFPGLTATAAYRYNGNAVKDAVAKTYAVGNGAIVIVEYNVAPVFVDLSADVDLSNSHYYVEGEAVYTIIPQLKIRAYGAYTESTNTNGNIKLNGSSTANNSLFGADLVFPVGKAEAMLGLAYGDKAKAIQIPLLVKANF